MSFEEEFIIRRVADRDELWKQLGHVAAVLGVSREDAAATLLQTAVENFDDAMGDEGNPFAIDCQCCADDKHEVEGSEKR